MGVAPDIHNARRASVLAQDLRALLGKLKRRLREQAGVGDLTPSQVSVLLRLEKDGPATASSLARAEGMRPQSIAPVIAALEGAGLVSGAADPTDGRQTLPLAHRRLSEAGQQRTRGASGLARPNDPGATFTTGTGRTLGRPRAAQAGLVDD